MRSGLDRLAIDAVRQAKVGRMWLSVLAQDGFWVPRDAFAALANAPTGTGIDHIPGAVSIASMSLAYRRNVEAFLWRKTKDLAFSQTNMELEMELAGMGDNALDHAARQVGAGRAAAILRVSERTFWRDRAAIAA
jgi:hypothetical protein